MWSHYVTYLTISKWLINISKNKGPTNEMPLVSAHCTCAHIASTKCALLHTMRYVGSPKTAYRLACQCAVFENWCVILAHLHVGLLKSHAHVLR